MSKIKAPQKAISLHFIKAGSHADVISGQTVEKAQRKLGFFLCLWYKSQQMPDVGMRPGWIFYPEAEDAVDSFLGVADIHETISSTILCMK